MQKFHFRDLAPIRLTLPVMKNKPVSWGYFESSFGLLKINRFPARRFHTQKSAFQFVKKIRSDLTSET